MSNFDFVMMVQFRAQMPDGLECSALHSHIAYKNVRGKGYSVRSTDLHTILCAALRDMCIHIHIYNNVYVRGLSSKGLERF